MDKWLGQIAEPSTQLTNGRVKAEMDFPWREVKVDLSSPALKSKADERREQAADVLELVDFSKDGLYIWRVNDGLTEHWRNEDFGQFYEKDCFILLHIRTSLKDGIRAAQPTLHLWVGRWVTPKNYEMGLYLTTQINARLDYDAVVHIEPQSKETSVFNKYFPTITYFKGVSGDSYAFARRSGGIHSNRLLKCHKPQSRGDHFRVNEVPARHQQLDSSFVFVMDGGSVLYQWNGELCKTEDVLRASRYVQSLKASRGLKVKIDVINDKGDDEGGHPFYMFLSRRSYLNADEEDADDSHRTLSFPTSKRSGRGGVRGYLYRVYVDGKKNFTRVKEGVITMKEVRKEMACIVDTGDIYFLWFSQQLAAFDRSRGLEIIHTYLQTTSNTVRPAIVLAEGHKCSLFNKALPQK